MGAFLGFPDQGQIGNSKEKEQSFGWPHRRSYLSDARGERTETGEASSSGAREVTSRT